MTIEIITEKHRDKEVRDLLLLTLLEFHFLNNKIDSLMKKEEFIAAIGDLKTEVQGIITKVGTLEDKINNSSTDVDPDIVAAFQDLKGATDLLNTKADNLPASPPAETTDAGAASDQPQA